MQDRAGPTLTSASTAVENTSTKNLNQVYFELIFALIFGIVAYLFGSRIYLQNIDAAAFYQGAFYAPLHFACTGTFESFLPSPAVSKFLSSPQSTFTDCAEVAALPKVMWGQFESGLIFLLGLAGLLWRFLGISWVSLAPIAGILTAALALSAYCLFRVFCRYPVIAMVMAAAFTAHPSVVGQIANLRDFSKAPFMVAALALTATAVLKPQTTRSTFILAAAAGAIIALALGFRPDVMAILPIAAAAPIFAFKKTVWKGWCLRSLALWLGLALGFIFVRAVTLGITPPLAVGNSFISHVFILGFAEVFASFHQGMSDASYRVVSAYFDEYVFGLTHLFQGVHLRAVLGGDNFVTPSYERYDATTLSMLLASFSMVPNDAIMRIFYSAQATHKYVPLVWGPMLIGMLYVLWVAQRRALIFLSFSFAFLTAVASLQFDSRHVFFFGIFGMSLGCMIFDCGLSAWRTRLQPHSMAVFGSAAVSFAAVIIGLSALFGLISVGTFYLQQKNITNSRILYETVTWVPIDFAQDGQKVTPGASLFAPKDGAEDEQYAALFSRLTLRSKLGVTSCAGDSSTLTQTHRYINSETTFKLWQLPHGAVRELYFPLVKYINLEFLRLDFLGDISGCDIEWHIAADLPPGTMPMELMVVDGQIQKSYRGSWQALAEKFIWE